MNEKYLKKYYPSIWINTWQPISSIIGSNSRYQKGIASSSKNEPKGGKAGTICIAYKNKANTDELMHGTKEKPLKTKRLFANVTYYKLQARKYFVYYIIGLGSQGYRIGGVEEILDQSLVIPGVSGN